MATWNKRQEVAKSVEESTGTSSLTAIRIITRGVYAILNHTASSRRLFCFVCAFCRSMLFIPWRYGRARRSCNISATHMLPMLRCTLAFISLRTSFNWHLVKHSRERRTILNDKLQAETICSMKPGSPHDIHNASAKTASKSKFGNQSRDATQCGLDHHQVWLKHRVLRSSLGVLIMQRVCRKEVVNVIRGHIYVWDPCKMGIERRGN
jgi:hypothetical protein